MLKVAAEAVRQVVGDEHHDLRIGMIYTCHTFGRDLGFKPHVHLVITKGGLDKDDNWVEIDGIPGGKLSARWRYLLCRELRRLRPYDDALRMTIDDLYRRFRGFQVYTDSFYPKGLEAAKYIGRYLGHPPLATSHITQYDGQRLQFWYRETATGLRREVNVSALEFISLLVPHPVQNRDGTGHPPKRHAPRPPRRSLCSQCQSKMGRNRNCSPRSPPPPNAAL
jgi:hypothetical protein